MAIELVLSIEIILAIFTGALGALILYTGRNLAAGFISILVCATIIFVAVPGLWWGALITIALIAAIGAYFFLDAQGYI